MKHLAYGFTPRQAWSAARANRRVNIWEGAVRSGKTIGSFVPWVEHVEAAPPGILFMVGNTQDTLNRNVLRPLQDILGARTFDYSLGKGYGTLAGREVTFVSARDEASYKKIRGSTVAGWYGDELTLWPQTFFVELLHRMSPPGSRGFGTTNPDSPFHYLKKEYLDRYLDLGWRRFKFTLEHNRRSNGGFLEDEFIEALKRENVGLFFQRFILGLWVQAAGAVYSMFDEEKHVRKVIPASFPQYGVAVDYGTINPTVFGLFGYGLGRKVYLIDLYYYDPMATNRTKTDRALADDFEAFVRGIPLAAIVADPSARSFIAELRERDYDIRPADNEVIDGIRVTSSKLAAGELILHDIPAMRPAIEEFGTYLWDEKAQLRGEDKPLKAFDHCFIAGTMIETINGPKPIESIRPGDLIRTRYGYFPAIKAGLSRENAKVITRRFSNSQVLIGTKDHLVYTNEKGFVPLETLTQSDTLYTMKNNSLHNLIQDQWQTLRRLNFKVLFTEDIPSQNNGVSDAITDVAPNTSNKDLGTFIGRYGKLIMVRFQKVIIFIIKMAIILITRLIILNWSLLRSMSTIMLKPTRGLGQRSKNNTLSEYRRRHRSGIRVLRVESGIGNNLANIGKTEKKKSILVSTAKRVTSQGISEDTNTAQMLANQQRGEHQGLIPKNGHVLSADNPTIPIDIASQKPVLRNVEVDTESANELIADVYNLTVLGPPEYFANGILVHNCMDMIRYFIKTLFDRGDPAEEYMIVK